MAILTLTSDHPEFTQLIKKHPEGGLQLRGIRNGTGFGWYEDPQTYCMYFQDYGTNLSFRSTREQQQHYLNVKQSCFSRSAGYCQNLKSRRNH